MKKTENKENNENKEILRLCREILLPPLVKQGFKEKSRQNTADLPWEVVNELGLSVLLDFDYRDRLLFCFIKSNEKKADIYGIGFLMGKEPIPDDFVGRPLCSNGEMINDLKKKSELLLKISQVFQKKNHPVFNMIDDVNQEMQQRLRLNVTPVKDFSRVQNQIFKAARDKYRSEES